MRVLTLVLVLWSVPAVAQEIVKNPNQIIVTCLDDHESHTDHEVQILKANGEIVQPLVIGTQPTDANGEFAAPLKVQPIAVGEYVGRVRAVSGAFKGEWSDPTPTFERVPGKPRARVQ